MQQMAPICQNPYMTSRNALNTPATLRLAMAPRTELLPGDRLMRNISAEAALRATTFLSHKRRLEFLWARVLLAKLLETEPCAAVVETPPRSPRIEGASFGDLHFAHQDLDRCGGKFRFRRY